MSQVIQFDNLAQVGLIKDTPDLTLPQSAFSDVLNVRFRNNAIRKIEGEVGLGNFGNGSNDIIFVTYWANPNLTLNNGYYVYVYSDGVTDTVAMRSVTGDTVNVLYTEDSGGNWQSTVFQGGYILILNNGKDVPKYLSDKTGNTDISDIQAYDLVGWNDDYSTLEEVVNLTYNNDTDTRDYSLGLEVDFTTTRVLAYILDDQGVAVERSELESNGTEGEFTLALDGPTNTHILTASTALLDNYQIVIYLQSVDNVVLTAGVIRAFGNLLIAGDLKETAVGSGEVIRRLTGAIRTSDIAQPGAVPTNWNPFAAGVTTADEYILSSTGVIRDIVELQGRAYIYTTHSIHSLTPTNSTSVPFSLNVVSSAYGAQSMDSVVEVDGKHIVVGSNDIYVFSGHPGNLQSIADDRVRYYFYDNLNKDYANSVRVIRYNRYNEVWFNFPNNDSVNGELNETLIWNYRTNLWTKRIISDFQGITTGLVEVNDSVDANQLYPILCSGNTLVAADLTYTDADDAPYESYIQRTNLELRPIIDTEYIRSFALYLQSEDAVTLKFKVNQKDNPSDATDFTNDKEYYFLSNTVDGQGNSTSDYKADVRVNGRFMGYRISDGSDNDNAWTLSSIVVEAGKAGVR
jgi:hypothetical protein